MGNTKRINRAFDPPAKAPRTSEQNRNGIDNFHNLTLSWQFKFLDLDHETWGWRKLKEVDSVLEKLRNFETMTWHEVLSNKKQHHSVPKGDLDKKAQKRLEELELDDISDLFRLRLGSKERVWGIIDRHVLKIIWWDPDHTVCLSNKKHT